MDKLRFKLQIIISILFIASVIIIMSNVSYALLNTESLNDDKEIISVGTFDTANLTPLTSTSDTIVINDLYPTYISNLTEGENTYSFTLSNTSDYIVSYKVYLSNNTVSFLEENDDYSNYVPMEETYYTYIDYSLDNKDANNLGNIYDESTSNMTILSGYLLPHKSEEHTIQFWLDNGDTTRRGAPNNMMGTILALNINLSGTIQDSIKFNFDYTGSEQEFTVPYDGYYRLEVWGASGGYAYKESCRGGYGAYSAGEIYLNEGTKLYINVGGEGTFSPSGTVAVYPGGYNGGGNGYVHSSKYNYAGAGGGGATHISLISGLLSSLETSRSDILIVAGAGGGAYLDLSVSANGYVCKFGGSGGGYIGGTIIGENNTVLPNYPTGGTQSTGGVGYTLWSSATSSSTTQCVGSFGEGGIGTDTYGGGGSGFYGGASGNFDSGAGGSGYIGNTSLLNKTMYCYNCEESTEDSTKTISTTNVSETPIKNYAKIGNGYARISLISQ